MSPAEENGRVLMGFVNGQPLYGTVSFTVTNNADSPVNVTIWTGWVSDNTSNIPPSQKTEEELIQEYIVAKFKK